MQSKGYPMGVAEKNEHQENILADLGFTKCGIIHVVEDNNPRFAYEELKEKGRMRG